MSKSTAAERAEQFLAMAGEFRLGALVTEQPHPKTRDLSETARVSVTDALNDLLDVDEDVIDTYRAWAGSGEPERIAETVLDTLRSGGRVYLTGCGSTGRLSILLESIWREYWETEDCRLQTAEGTTLGGESGVCDLQSAVRSVMAGGDYALIKAVEGFEDFAEFGAKQLTDMGVSQGDIVFAITEGGETSFVIGTAWKGLEAGAKVYLVYCNPDELLRETVARSREVLDEPRIEKINLTTGPMAIMGSTRMQATTIQLLALMTVFEMAAANLTGHDASSESAAEHTEASESAGSPPSRTRDLPIPKRVVIALEHVHKALKSERERRDLAGLVYLEETVYRLGGKSTYFADRLAIDVLTDTTERSPTFSIPAFRKWDDEDAADSWTFLILPQYDSKQAWTSMLKRPPYGIEWGEEEIREMIGDERSSRLAEVVRRIGPEETLRFRIGREGLESRPVSAGDAAVCVMTEAEREELFAPTGFYRSRMEASCEAGACPALVYLARPRALKEMQDFLLEWDVSCRAVMVPLPETGCLLGGIIHVAIKMLLNALSTCTMTRLGRVLGNCMVAVVPSNLKLIDRATRYIQSLTGLSYEDACRELFESMEYVKPRMDRGQAYPPVVALSVARVREGCSNEQAEDMIVSRQDESDET